MVESNKHYNFAGHQTVDYGLIMVEAKELRVFVYLLVFFPAIWFRACRIEYGFPETLE